MLDAADLKRTLIVRTDRIGDVILTLPMITAIRRRCPDAHIAFLCRRYTRPLLEGNGGIDEIIEQDATEEGPLVERLRAGSYTAAFAPSPTLSQARLLRAARIPVRVSTAYRWYSRMFTRRIREHRSDARRNEAEYNVRMVDPVNPATPHSHPARVSVGVEAYHRVSAWLRDHGIREERFVVVHPGSGGSALDLPPERFGAVASRLRRELGFDVVVTGITQEGPLADLLDRAAGEQFPRMFDHPLGDVIALAALAKCVVANSTGVLHIGAAVGTPVVGLYPPIRACSPVRWGPWSERAVTLVPEVGMVCDACRGAACEFHDCMRLIPTSSIVAAVRSLCAAEVAA